MAKINDHGNQLSSPVWLADFLDPKTRIARFPAKVVASQFQDAEAVKVTLTAGASADAVSISVAALSASIPSGTLLHFGESKEFAKVTAAAAAGSTSLTVEALPQALESGDVAYYTGNVGTRKMIEGATLVGRTFAERDAGTGFGPADIVNDDEIYLTLFTVPDAFDNNDVELVRHGTTIKENFLPKWTELNTASAEIQSVVITGTLSAGNFTFFDPRSGETSTAVAYNGNLAAIQAALDEIYGASNSVAAGTIASFTITFGGTLAEVDMPPIQVRPDGVTGFTGANVSQTRTGGRATLEKIRKLYTCIRGEA